MALYKVKFKGMEIATIIKAESEFDAIRGFVSKQIESVEEHKCDCKTPCATCKCTNNQIGVSEHRVPELLDLLTVKDAEILELSEALDSWLKAKENESVEEHKCDCKTPCATCNCAMIPVGSLKQNNSSSSTERCIEVPELLDLLAIKDAEILELSEALRRVINSLSAGPTGIEAADTDVLNAANELLKKYPQRGC